MKNPFLIKYMVSGTVFILLLVCAGLAFAGLPPTEVVLNKSILLRLNNPVERISIAKPEIADVTLISPQQMQITGSALGVTNLIVWDRVTGKTTMFDIHVIGDVDFIEQQIREKIAGPNDDIKVEYANESIVLYGKAHNQETINKALELAAAYAGKEVVRKETSPDGTVTDVTAKLLVNHIVIDNPQQVVLQVKVAQVDKTALRKLGISGLMKGNTAAGFYNTIGAPDGDLSGGRGDIGSLTDLAQFTAGVAYFPAGVAAVIKALTTKGLAKILAEPNLLVKSGEKGEFLAGSKIPYNIVTSTGGTATTSIYFVDVGIKLYFAPEVMENGLINLKIDPAEVSNVAGTLEVNGYPIIDIRSVKTFAELKDGESLVLAGLLSESTIKTMSKIPLIGDIPILGALFRSTNSDIAEKELVFFITPKIVTPMAPGTTQELPTDKPLTPEQENELKWMPLGK